MRRRCCNCARMTENWQRINGSPWHCYDGCKSTTGYDRREDDRLLRQLNSQQPHKDEKPMTVTYAPSIAADLRLTPQARTILAHLQKHTHITPMQALVVHSIPRLSSCICEIRNKAGYEVTTTICHDDAGGKYGKYSLAPKKALN